MYYNIVVSFTTQEGTAAGHLKSYLLRLCLYSFSFGSETYRTIYFPSEALISVEGMDAFHSGAS